MYGVRGIISVHHHEKQRSFVHLHLDEHRKETDCN